MLKGERMVGILIAAGGLAVALYAYYYLKLGQMISPDAGFLPFLLGLSLLILGVILFFMAHFGVKSGGYEEELGKIPAGEPPVMDSQMERLTGKLLLGIIVLIFYALLLERVGYFLATAVFMGGWQLLVERERLLKAVLITLIASGVMYGLFKYILRVHVPSGAWFA